MNNLPTKRFDHKFDMEKYLRSNESFEHKEITSTFILVIMEILSVFKMSEYKGDGRMCNLSYAQIGATIRLSAPTVGREVRKAIRLKIIQNDGYEYNGQAILIPGKWFEARKLKFLAEHNIKRCGTVVEPQAVDNSVSKPTPPDHCDTPPPITETYPPDHCDRHITDAFTDSLNRKDDTSQQVQYLIKIKTEKTTMHRRNDDRPLPYINPFKQKQPELPEDHGRKMLAEMAKILNKVHELNH